ncbi:hypothetical protein O6H91_06G112800 [Diphasiastrum complanatum]|uniref:Uncharacterized protein n=2 Tax=Diphasiastrum complanatum TaxID=34168 RepID=A0ACC2DHJ2_DIPCM|nr:hypothetical protein O6H91_06G083100 [Diphasiastrum complanatum]KAJ7553783.1 hypothetical protein O6H91_06G112800 [Diphasiastrum complanatum]
MPRAKRKSGEDEFIDDDGSEEESQRPSKKTSHGDSTTDGIVACEISKNRKVSVRKWKGQVFVDIREFYNKGDQALPSKKGISLTLDQWKVLRDHAEDVDEAISGLE